MIKKLPLLIVAVIFMACNKDSVNTVPHIEYKRVNSGLVTQSNGAVPTITFKLTDSEGDFGPIQDEDTSYIYVLNKLTNELDSFQFPDLTHADKKNFKVDVDVAPRLGHFCSPSTPTIDTIYYDIYVKDIGKHVSNTITTADPVLYSCFP